MNNEDNIYELVRDYEHPCGAIRKGSIKTIRDWRKTFPNIHPIDFPNRTDWFKLVNILTAKQIAKDAFSAKILAVLETNEQRLENQIIEFVKLKCHEQRIICMNYVSENITSNDNDGQITAIGNCPTPKF